MSSCVVKNKEFYSLAEEHGVNGNELELIVHKYWNETGKEDSFPPSSYIDEQLGIGKAYTENGNSVIKLWEKEYSRPVHFQSQIELDKALEKAKTFFPESAIITYKDNKDNYVLRIAKPEAPKADYYQADTTFKFNYNGESRQALQGKIAERIKSVQEKISDIHNVISLMNIAKEDYKYLQEKNRIGALRRKVGDFNKAYGTNIRVDSHGNIISDLVVLEQQLAQLKDPALVDGIIKNWNLEQAAKRQAEIDKDLELVVRDDYMSQDSRPSERENQRAEKILRNEGIVFDDSLIDSFLGEICSTNPYHQIFKQVVDILRNNNIPIKIVADAELNYIAARRQDGFKTATVRFNPSRLLQYLMTKPLSNVKSNVMQILTHELVHAVTAEILESHPSWAEIRGFDKTQTEFTTDTWKLYQQCKEQLAGTEWYGLTNVKEFVAEALTNRNFQIKLSEIKVGKEKKSVFQKFVNYVTRLFNKIFENHGINIQDSALEQVISISEKYFEYANKGMNRGIDDYKSQSFHSNMFEDNFSNVSTEESKEMDAIKQRAIANGTFMKAPNGKDTLLSEGQWLQIRTANFKNWFGDWENSPSEASKVVDENGEPLVVYHESPNAFETFDVSKKRYNVHDARGIWASSVDRKGKGYGENVYPLFLNLRNPASTSTRQVHTITELRALENKALRKPNSDGAILETIDKFGFETQYYVKSPNQAKSATSNNGDFSAADNSIYHERESAPYTSQTSDALKTLFNKGEATIKDLVGIVNNSEYKDIINALKAISGGKNKLLGDVKVKLVSPLSQFSKVEEARDPFKGRRAYYNAETKTIVINVDSGFVNGDPSSVIMHEIMHHVTVSRILGNSELRAKFYDIIQQYRKHYPGEYREMSDVHFIEEFIADLWSNKSTIEKAKKIKYEGEGYKGSLWDRIKQFFKSELFTGGVENSLFERASELMVELIDSDAVSNSVAYNNVHYTTETKSKQEMGGRLAYSNSQGVTVSEDITVKGFFDYLQGKVPSGTSKQKKVVFERLAKRGYTETLLRKIIRTNEDATKLIQYHEYSHLYHNDRENYYEGDPVDSSGKRNVDWLREHKLQIEERATIDAINRLISEKGLDRAFFEGMQNSADFSRQIPDRNAEGPLKNFTLHSGGAKGADFIWGSIGARYGVEGKHYFDAADVESKKPPYANTPITNEDRTTGERKAYRAGRIMGRLKDNAKKVSDPLLIRDWNQVKDADMVVAIAEKFNMPGDKLSDNPTDDRTALQRQVSGGTGWAVQMAISEGKPVYVFNQADGKWYMNFMGAWQYAEAPVLTENFAGIGTRKINDSGIAAIRDCYERTVKAQTETVSETSMQTQPSDIDRLSPEMRAEFDRITRRNTAINNVLSSEAMTATEARETVDALIGLISDYITEVINDPAIKDYSMQEQDQEAYLRNLLVNKNFEGVITPFNPSGLSRLEIINRIGIDNLVNILLKSKLVPNADTTFKQGKKMKVLRDNLDAILYIGANTLSINEGIHLTSTQAEGHETRNAEEGVVLNPDLNDARNAESIQENEGSLQEHWQIETKTMDVVETMSQVVRNELFKMYQLNSDGSIVTGVLGINKRIPVQESTRQLLGWTQGSLTLSDMVHKLKGKEGSNPWVRQVIEKLEDATGQYTDFQNAFFTTFNKHFLSYSVTVSEDGVIKRIPLNEKPFLKGVISQLKVDISAGIHPLFGAKGVNQLGLENFKTVLDTLHRIKDNELSKLGLSKMTDQDKQSLFEAISQAAGLLGYPVDATTIENTLTGRDIVQEITHLDNMYNDILANVSNPDYAPLSFNKGKDGKQASGIRGSLSRFLDPLTRNMQDLALNTVFDSGKMYQSYVTPSYISKLFLKFSEADEAKFEEFVQNEFGQYDWFKERDSKSFKSGWRNEWLRRLAIDPEARKVFKLEHKLNYNKHSYMKDMTGNEYIMSLLSSFFSEGAGNGKEGAVAWYRVPIMSNKSAEEYIRFYADMGSNYKDNIATKMTQVFNQELSRIQTVLMQDYSKSDPRYIKNFHSNGKRFCFLDFMNAYLKGGEKAGTQLGKLLEKKLTSSAWDVAKEPELYNLVKEAIRSNMQEHINNILEDYANRGIMETAKDISGIDKGYGRDNIAENIERFLWNDTFAATQILQLTVTDIAYFKDMTDLQKRLAQLHSPGMKGNKEAVDYEGNPVSDGYHRTMYIKNFDGVKSNIIDNLKVVFERKLQELEKASISDPEAKKRKVQAQKDFYDNIIRQFENIDVTDGQAYSSPTSYRKKMLMFGKWSKQAESVYQKLMSGNYNHSDLSVAFQPLKPFVYSQISKPTGLENAPLRNIKLGVQNKNSEYLLIMADAILQGEDTGQPNLLRAIFEVMEESAKLSPTRGIDTIQFDSTVKVGLMGICDFNQVLSGSTWSESIEVKDPSTGKKTIRTRGEAAAKAYMEHCLYSKNAEGYVTGYNSTFVHEIPVEDFSLQQDVPEHFKDHMQQHGSQIRMIVPSDLVSVDSYGQPVTYTVEGRQLTADQFRAEYENTIAENISQSIKDLYREFHLDALNPVEKNIVLSRLLQKEILSSPRYGLDLYRACSLDSQTGEFRIPLGDPIQSARIEQMLNSIIKKRVNEQKMSGGPVVQVTNFGTSKRLNIHFKDRNGGTLMTRAEFEKSWKPTKALENNSQNVSKLAKQLMTEEKLSYATALKEAQSRLSSPKKTQTVDEAYSEYIKTNQGGIAYFEAYAPMFSDEVFTRFANADGTIDIKTMEEVCPEALQLIGYRIPTEDKYSCAPIKIVGFLPREAGEGIMLPYDITLLTGCDYDVDKEYLMRKKVNIKLKPFKEQYELLEPYFLEAKKKDDNLKRDYTPQEKAGLKRKLSEMIDMFRSNDSRHSYNQEAGTSLIEKLMWGKFKRTCYNVSKPNEGKSYRDNKIFDMSWEVFTHESSTSSMLNPGGFEEQKKQAYLIEAFKNNPDKTWEELEAMSASELKDMASGTKNLLFLDSQVDFYEKNNAASTILGMFAVQKIGHAVLEGNKYMINVGEVCRDSEPFVIAGMKFGGSMEFDRTTDSEGNTIGKTLGSHVAASADAAKEPCLDLLNINSKTLGVFTALIRLGMPFKNASMFIAQPVIRELLNVYNRRNLTDYVTFDTVLNEYIQSFREEGNMYDSTIEHENLDLEELRDNLRQNRPETNYKVAVAYAKMQRIAYALKGPTFLTRYNSISNAVGPLITDNLVTGYKTVFDNTGLYDKNSETLVPETVFKDHPVLKEFASTYQTAEEVFKDFPAMSPAFSAVLGSIPSAVAGKVYQDRTLLNSLKDFFVSHTLVDKGVVNENRVGYYVKEYAGEFVSKDIKGKNLGSEILQAIKIKQDNETGEYSLELSTTGMDQQSKDRLSASWLDLYKSNKDLAMDLFYYNFFKGGIGYTPKTFMNLLPLEMREAIPGYTECFTDIPIDSAPNIWEQFLAHNTSNFKLFPVMTSEATVQNGYMSVVGKEASKFENVPMFRVKDSRNKWRYMVRQLADVNGEYLYKEIVPLGENGSYLEMSSNMVQISVKNLYGTSKKANQAYTPSTITEKEGQPIESTDTGIVQQTPGQVKAYAESLIQGMVKNYPGVLNTESAKNMLLKIKDGTIDISNSAVQDYLRKSIESQGLKLDIDKLNSELEKLC